MSPKRSLEHRLIFCRIRALRWRAENGRISIPMRFDPAGLLGPVPFIPEVAVETR
jgi:hypothetical protein